ncbi:MAG: substrate-binding domain-containing protein [Nocardioidaceae bacterium]
MRKSLSSTLAVLAAFAMVVSACGNDDSGNSSGDSTKSSDGPLVGVILPDTTSSARYTQYDAPLLTKAFEDAGIKADIQNAQGDNAKFVSIAQSMISEGVKVLVIDPADPATGISVESSAKAAGIAVIDYDRVNLGGSADYYVSFDNVAVGKLQGQGLLDCLGDKQGAQIIELNGGTDIDNNAVLFKQGAHEVLDPAVESGQIKIAQEVDVSKWDNSVAATDFQQLLTKNGGKVDGVLAANDGIAAAAIGILKSKNLQVPVTGQDATTQGLQFILTGDQCMTVFKDVSQEADAAAKLAIALAKGDTASAEAMATGSLEDPENGRTIPSVLLVPQAITIDNVQDVVDAGAITVADLCKGVEQACKDAGIS